MHSTSVFDCPFLSASPLAVGKQGATISMLESELGACGSILNRMHDTYASISLASLSCVCDALSFQSLISPFRFRYSNSFPHCTV